MTPPRTAFASVRRRKVFPGACRHCGGTLVAHTFAAASPGCNTCINCARCPCHRGVTPDQIQHLADAGINPERIADLALERIARGQRVVRADLLAAVLGDLNPLYQPPDPADIWAQWLDRIPVVTISSRPYGRRRNGNGRHQLQRQPELL